MQIHFKNLICINEHEQRLINAVNILLIKFILANALTNEILL